MESNTQDATSTHRCWRTSKKSFLNGNKYYIAFIDDYTIFYWIYFLKFKSEVAKVFWIYKIWVENQSGCKMQIIRLDNGKEYTCDSFNKFCDEAGIKHQCTTPYTPPQNGISERKNRSITKMTRCMLHEKELPNKLWA